MTRLIFTFKTLFQVLAADKLLVKQISCRPTPMPPGLSSSICGMAVEVLDLSQEALALRLLEEASLTPSGVHRID